MSQLENNTSELENILQMVNNLPDAGGGENGGYYIPSVSHESGIMWVYFTPSKEGMLAIEPVAIALPEGADGADASQFMAVNSMADVESFIEDEGYTPYDIYVLWGGEDGTPYSYTIDLVNPTITLNKGDIWRFTQKNLKINGAYFITNVKGDKGDPGSKGDKGNDGKTPVRGTDYWTATDKQEIKNEVISSIITQEAGESTSLVMSQKAVTDLVHDALGSGGGIEYETVDSVEEMIDTSKQYVLRSTGTIWAYGESGLKADFENKADFEDKSDNNWVLGYRLSSSGVSTTSTASPAPLVTNYISCAVNDVIRVKGLTLGSSNCSVFKGNKVNISSSKPTFPGTTASSWTTEMEGADIYKFTAINAETTYLRFGGVPVGNVNDIIITKNQPITYSTGYAWYDTEMKPSASGGDGGNYVNLFVKVTENKANIEHLNDRVANIETGSDSLTIPSFWQNAVDACIERIKALQIGKNCVTFPFFSDNHTRDGKTQYMGMLIAHVMKECNIPYCFCGGDVITSAVASTADSDTEFRAQAKAFNLAMSYIPEGRFCMTLGNHEGYLKKNPDIVGSTTVNYSRDQAFDIFMREEGIAQNKHYGIDGTYYYIDDIVSKVRWIVLNTNGIGNNDIDDAQLSWLQNTALKFNESGWGVVFISHHPITNHYEQTNITNAAAVISKVQSYMNGSDANKADIIGWYSGHIHRDRIYSGVSVNDTDDTEGAAMGFKQITITSDHTTIAYPIGESPTYHPIANDDKSHAIDFVTINRDTRTVNITRLGIGEDRSYTY